jgi:3-oxoacyl-[acyl-carrier protein] reductase
MKVLITGGASGLGRAITMRFASESKTEVNFTYSKSLASAEEIVKASTNTRASHLDFRDSKQLDEFCNRLVDTSPDILINNAIVTYPRGHFHKAEARSYFEGFASNVMPTLLITKAFLALARKRRSGKIITILSSALINRPPLGSSQYVAEKAYLFSMAKSWAVENSTFGITSNCVSPSFMDTPLNEGLDNRVLESIIASTPGSKLLLPEEVAEAVFFLAHSTTHINGANILINAGESIA